MKQIQPINIWKNGQQIQANYLELRVVHDDLINSATFYYSLNESQEGGICADGNITILEQEYQDWGENTDINEDAFNIAANKLNLTYIN